MSFIARGGVRVMHKRGGRWRAGPLQAAPRLEAGRRLKLRLRDGEVECAGRVVVHIQPGRGRLGLGVHDSAADFVLHRPDATTR